MPNIINAIINLVNNPVYEIRKTYASNNRANSAGDALEEYVKDLFSGTFNIKNKAQRLRKISEVFSYLGNATNPPDALLKNGDAIEVKKIESNNSVLALNSSYPKQKLYSDSTMISNACKIAEKWSEKDMIYIIGVVQKDNLKHLSMVYGLDYCASLETYEGLKTKIKEGIKLIPHIELTETNELAKLNKIDPLEITYLRIRGMWGIENPWEAFNYVYQRDMEKKFNFMCIINEDKWKQFENTGELLELECNNKNLCISDIEVKNPDNPAQLRKAKLITFTI